MAIPGITYGGSVPFPRQAEMSNDNEPCTMCIDKDAAIDPASGPNAPEGLITNHIPSGCLMALQADHTCLMVLDSDLLDNAGPDEQDSESVVILFDEVINDPVGGAIADVLREADWTGGMTGTAGQVENRLYHNGPALTKSQREKFGQRLRIFKKGY